MQTKAGLKLRSQTCTTEVIVVRAATGPIELSCCGAPMTIGEAGDVPAGAEDEILLGKRYTDEESGVEVLCTKPGPGPLAAEGRTLLLKGTKPLPSSD